MRDPDGSLVNRSERNTAEKICRFRHRLLAWFADAGRAFPWRATRDPFAILMAEMMLRRTQARQVVPVFYRFIEHYPSAGVLARASAGEVQAILTPLGLGWRQAAFIPLAMQLVERFNGEVPRDRAALLSLPGVGPYVADAVRVLAFGEAAAVIDTNTVRVAGRFLGFPTHAESRRKKAVQDAVATLVDPARPRDANLALLDFAALVCRATRPLCDQCPMNDRCAYARQQCRDATHEIRQADRQI